LSELAPDIARSIQNHLLDFLFVILPTTLRAHAAPDFPPHARFATSQGVTSPGPAVLLLPFAWREWNECIRLTCSAVRGRPAAIRRARTAVAGSNPLPAFPLATRSRPRRAAARTVSGGTYPVIQTFYTLGALRKMLLVGFCRTAGLRLILVVCVSWKIANAPAAAMTRSSWQP